MKFIRICILCLIVLKYLNIKVMKEIIKENVNRFNYINIKYFQMLKSNI